MNPSSIHLAIVFGTILLIVAGVLLARVRRPAAGATTARSTTVRSVVSLLAVLAVADLLRGIVMPDKLDAERFAAIYAHGRVFPIRINDAMQFDSVGGTQQVVTFNISIHLPDRTVDDVGHWVTSQHDRQLAAACGNPEVAKVLDQGLVVEYVYHYAAIPVANLVLSKNTCASI